MSTCDNLTYAYNRVCELDDEYEQGLIDEYTYHSLKEEWLDTIKTLERDEE